MRFLRILLCLFATAWSTPSKADWYENVICRAKLLAQESEKQQATRKELERKISKLLRWSKDGVQKSSIFEGCVLIVKNDYSKEQQLLRHYSYIEKRINVGYLNTDYCALKKQLENDTGFSLSGRTTLFYKPKSHIYNRLSALEKISARILDEEMARYPYDVKTRLQVMAKRMEVELEDKIYLDAGQGFMRNDYTWNFSPKTNFLFSPPSDQSEEFMKLLDIYSYRFCSGDKSG